MKKQLYFTLIFISILCVSVFTSNASMQDIDPKYQTNMYMKATGSGQSEAEAKNSALSELSKIFESKVVSETNDRIKAVISSGGKYSDEQSVDSHIKVVSSVELKGAEIAGAWYDQKAKLYYATAVLDRFMARDNWMKQVTAIDDKIDGIFKSIESSESKIMKLKALKGIQNNWIEREVIVSRIRVLGFEEGEKTSYDIKSVFKQIPELKAGMPVIVTFGGDNAKNVKKKTSEALSKAGFLITDDRKKAEVMVTGDVSSQRLHSDDKDWVFVRADATVKIVDLKSGLTIHEVSDNARAAQLSYDEGVYKATLKLATTLAEKMIKGIETQE